MFPGDGGRISVGAYPPIAPPPPLGPSIGPGQGNENVSGRGPGTESAGRRKALGCFWAETRPEESARKNYEKPEPCKGRKIIFQTENILILHYLGLKPRRHKAGFITHRGVINIILFLGERTQASNCSKKGKSRNSKIQI